MFDFMLAVMNATGPEGVPTPPAAVDAYFVDNDDDFSAGVGKKGGELPTEGWWLWEETDKGKIEAWAFKNRKDLWGMLYGAAEVPKAGCSDAPTCQVIDAMTWRWHRPAP